MAESISRVLSQPKMRPKLAELKRVCPQDLAHCEGYVWHTGPASKLGKGSFGEVFLGWTSDGSKEVAVKVVRKEFFKQDPKVKENLDREIRILKLLRGCDYVVQLHHVQDLKHHKVLVMELCDFDLDHLVKIKPFKEQDIIIFLYQLAQGMKALREQNIVHRDLKPGNILIKRHETTGKMMIKLADFGFARHFKGEGMKPIDMTSLAGTPVFMAPEALECVFHPGKHYDDKVDIWSIGALLYKVIVGTCGFYAELQNIPRILKHKGDAIAFERVPRSSKVNYVSELPATVNNRLSEPFRDKMNQLLQAMLKLGPAERMTFNEFYMAVDDIITSKIEIVNLLHGSSTKVMNDPQITVSSLTDEVYSNTHVPQACQVVFSNASRFYIAPGHKLTHDQFKQLLEESGGNQGHAKLYLLPINQVESETLALDTNCLAGLGMVIEDERLCVTQIVDHKLSDEMVHMVYDMSAQQKAQMEGLNELAKFVSREITLFSSQGYKQLSKMGHHALAKANLAVQWLQQDLSSLSDKSQGQLTAQLHQVQQYKNAIEKLVNDLGEFNSAANISMSLDLKEEELTVVAKTLSDESKKLPKLRKDHIYNSCKTIYEDCQKLIKELTEKVKGQLRPVWSRLSAVWRVGQASDGLGKLCSGLEGLLDQVALERANVLRSISGGAVQTGALAGSGITPPPLLVTPPPGSPNWSNSPKLPGPPQAMNNWGTPPQTTPTDEAYKKENADMRAQIEALNSELATLRINAGSSGEEEATIRPGAVAHLRPQSSGDTGESTSSDLSDESVRTLETLTGQLKHFCTTAEKLKPGISASPKGQPPKGAGGALYPNLLEDYSVISMPTDGGTLPDNLSALLPQASHLAELLRANGEGMIKASTRGTVTATSNSGLIKIGRPSEYIEGDIVIFHQVKLIKSKQAVPVVLHLEKPRPYILMDEASFPHFNIRSGKSPDLIIGKLTEKPRRLRFEDHPYLAEGFGSPTGEFYRVNAESTVLKFSAPRSAPSRPPPPAADNSEEKKKKTGGFFRQKKDKGGFV